jgi:hypothetical protein
MQTYRGDTFEFDFNAKSINGEAYIFKTGDSLKIGVKEKASNMKYVLFKKIDIKEDTETITISFSHEEMKKCNVGDKILEVELTDKEGNVRTLYQDTLTIMEDVINE